MVNLLLICLSKCQAHLIFTVVEVHGKRFPFTEYVGAYVILGVQQPGSWLPAKALNSTCCLCFRGLLYAPNKKTFIIFPAQVLDMWHVGQTGEGDWIPLWSISQCWCLKAPSPGSVSRNSGALCCSLVNTMLSCPFCCLESSFLFLLFPVLIELIGLCIYVF